MAALRVRVTLARLTAGLAMTTGCVHAPPASVDGAPSTAPRPGAYWNPPATALAPDSVPRVAIPADLEQRVQQLGLGDVVDIALRNNPATTASWAQARAAAATFGAARGEYYPTITAGATVTRTRTVTAQSNAGIERTQFSPTVSLSYLLFDFGGRSGAVEAARQGIFIADFSHNATVQNVILGAEGTYFSYLANRALVAAQQVTEREATANLQAAQQRHHVGLATIADVLQAQTALSQAQLALEQTQGNLQTARGALAVALGIPANLPYDIAPDTAEVPVRKVAESVDSLVERAVQNRPDLAAARAQVRQSEAQVRETRSLLYPALTLSGNAGRTYSDITAFNGPTYTVSLGLQFPLFTGFTYNYNVIAAQARAQATAANAEAARQQVIYQVFTSYYALQTATQRVRTAADLLRSAQQSEQVAAGRYREGVGTILDLLTAQAALADARAQQIQSRFTWNTALSQLAHDAGILGIGGEVPIRLAPDSTNQPPR